MCRQDKSLIQILYSSFEKKWKVLTTYTALEQSVTSKRPYTYGLPSTQWAAVTTHFSPIIEPPHE